MTTVSHWSTDGLTVGDVEKVSCPVIVDLELAAQSGIFKLPSCGRNLDGIRKFWLPPINQHEVNEIYAPYSLRHTRLRKEDLYLKVQKLAFQGACLGATKFMDELDESSRNGNIKELLQCMQSDDNVMLLPGVIVAFALRNRKWVQLDLENIEPNEMAAGWDDLVLPVGHKQMVQAMVESHTAGSRQSGKNFEADLVQEKGGLGYNPQDVERYLEKLFGLAHKWGCVLLLDKADIFLAKRTKDNLERNVFLRAIEYYQGILFITTNRVGAIDDAFRSRLHLALYYPPLSKKKSLKIWKMNLRRLKERSEGRIEEGKPGIIVQQKKILAFADASFDVLHWNGRQIRNAFQTALSLAEFKVRDSENPVPVVGKDEFRTIGISLEQFDMYLKQTHGLAEDHIAQRDRVRVDTVNLKGRLKKIFDSESSDSDSDLGSGDEDDADSERKGDNDGDDSGSSDESSDNDAKKRKKKSKSKGKSKANANDKLKERKEKRRKRRDSS
ncbi:hypothetical protein QQX98_009854 [Neonectria punicea]|uniref:AAA+ ATPase lid domain-containing protein n=1 Tax=Neonectria punicea TaxID=979145 RepID=A0ABR1GR87_9HYPO